MSQEEKNILSDETETTSVRNDWKAWRSKLTSKAIVDIVPFLTFVAVLCVIYIGVNKKAIETQRALNNMSDTLKELRWEYMNVKSQMMSAQMEIEVMKKSADIGLKPMIVPAFNITDDTITAKPQLN